MPNDVFDTIQPSSGDVFDQVADQIAHKPIDDAVSKALRGVPRPKAITPESAQSLFDDPTLSSGSFPSDVRPTPSPNAKPRTPLPTPRLRDYVAAGINMATDPQMGGGQPWSKPGSEGVQGAEELATPGKRLGGAAKLINAAGDVASPLLGGAAFASPVKAATSVATGFAASQAAKRGTKALGGGEQAQELAETLGFWAPTTLGILHPKLAVAVSPEEVRIGGAVQPPGMSPKGVSVSFPRGPRAPAGGGLEAPTIEGNAQPPDQVAQSIAEYETIRQNALSLAQGKPPSAPLPSSIPPPPPAPPPLSASPNAPVSVKQGRLDPEEIARVGKVISTLPPDVKAKAMQETHATLTQVLSEQGQNGPVVLPNGQLADIRDPEAASKQALSIINDAVKDHDKAESEAQKEAEKAEKEAEQPKAVAKVSSRQKAADLAAKAPKSPDLFDRIKPQKQNDVFDQVGLESGNGNKPTTEAGTSSQTVIAPAQQNPPSPGSPERVSEGRGDMAVPKPVASVSGEMGSVETPKTVETGFAKGSPVTFSRNMQVSKGNGSSEIIRVGTKGYVEHAQTEGASFARIRLEDGRVQSVPLRYLEAGHGEVRADQPAGRPPSEISGSVEPTLSAEPAHEPVATPAVSGEHATQPTPNTQAATEWHAEALKQAREKLPNGTLGDHLREAARIQQAGKPVQAPRPIVSGPAPEKVGEMNVSDLKVAPTKFQYKFGTDTSGTSTLLKEAAKYNPELAGTISVWRDPADGKYYVVNGHHRFELAKRMGEKTVAVRHVVAKDATEARAIGALQNIAEGRGTAVDAAKFFRDTGLTVEDLKAKGISLGEATAADGIALSRLSPEIFNRVVVGTVAPGRAKTIGEATPDHAEQKAILSLVEKKEARGTTVNNATLAELIRLVKGSEQTTETTADLFGNQTITKSLAIEKAEISAHIKQQLAKDKKLFGFVAKEGRADELARAGNKIEVEKSKEISTQAAQAEEVYNKLSERGGPISGILDQAARRLADGDNAGTVKAEAYSRVRAEVSKTLGGSEGASVGRSETAPEPPSGKILNPIPQATADIATDRELEALTRAHNNNEFTEVTIPITDLRTRQKYLQAEGGKSNSTPEAYKTDAGEYVLLDGNHRVVRAMERGDKNIKVNLWDTQPKAEAVEPTLPGMEHVPSERAEASAEQQGKDLTAKLTEPPKSIESKAGEIEQKSPLFRDTEANPQRDMFGELLKSEKGEAEPAKAAEAISTVAAHVGDFLRQEVEDTQRAKELQWQMYDLDKRHEARVIRAKQMLDGLQKDGVTLEDREAIDAHLDALQADSDSVPVPSLTPKQDQILDQVLMPMKSEAEAAFKKVNTDGLTIPNYNPRQTKGKMGMLDRFLMPEGEKRTGRSNLMSKQNPAAKHRTMMALEFERAGPQSSFIYKPGDRVVVSLKGGQVTAWDNGAPSNIGPIMDTEEGKGFVDSDGNIWKLKQATKKEIEKHTNVEYYHDAAASTIVNWLQAKKAEAAHDFIENFKSDPEFKNIAIPTGGDAPKGWNTTNLPQMKGYYFEPHTAEVFDWFFDRLKSGNPNAFDSINRYMRAMILLNPIKHPLNVGAQWAVEKGVTGFLPHKWMTIGRTGGKAIGAVWNQNQDFLDALDAGGALQSAHDATKDLVKTFYEQLGDATQKGEPWATKLAKSVGLAPVELVQALHKFSSKIAWPVSDMMMLQSAYQYQAEHPGVGLHDALREVGRIIPEYRLPTRILDSPMVGKVMSSNIGTVFGSYHYGLLRSFTESAKSALGGAKPAPGRTGAEESGKGWDRLALMALGAFGFYAVADQLAKKITGDKDAKFQRHGIFGLIQAVSDVAHKEATPTQAITKVVTPNPATLGLTQLAFDRDFRTGRQIYDPAAKWSTEGSQLMQYLKEELIPQNSQIERAQHSHDGWKKFAWSQADVNFPKSGAAKLAAQIASSKMDTSAWSPEEREKYYARSEALDGLRAGDSKAFERGLESGKITPDEINAIVRRSMGSQLYDKVHGFTYEETMRVYNKAVEDKDEEAQQELFPLLMEKMQHEMQKGHPVEAPEELTVQ